MSYTRAQRGVSFWFVSKKKQPVSLVGLESERSELLEKSFGLGDLRSGSVTAVVQRCGKPTGDCAWPNDPGHHPQFQTRLIAGKTITESCLSYRAPESTSDAPETQRPVSKGFFISH